METAIEQELLNRLKQGTYGDIYNFDQKVYERVLEAAEVYPSADSKPIMHNVSGCGISRSGAARLLQCCSCTCCSGLHMGRVLWDAPC